MNSSQALWAVFVMEVTPGRGPQIHVAGTGMVYEIGHDGRGGGYRGQLVNALTVT